MSGDTLPLVEGVQDEGNDVFLAVLQGTAMFVLLIACVNVANLLLARGSARQKELAVRVALGASRGRLLRQLLTESVVLALVGAGVSLLVASIGVDLIREGMPATIRRFIYGWNDIDVDGRVLAFTAGVGILAGLIFGLAPAWQGSRSELAETLKEGGRTSAPGRARMRAGLVVAEVAIALMLLVSAGLMIRGAFRLINAADRGYEPEGVLSANLVLPDGKYARGGGAAAVFQETAASARRGRSDRVRRREQHHSGEQQQPIDAPSSSRGSRRRSRATFRARPSGR